MLLIFFKTMFLLTLLALKIIISTFVYATDVEPPITCVTSYKVISNPTVFTASLTLPILLITFCVSINVFYFFFWSCFFRWYVLSVSLSTTSSNAATSLSNSTSCPCVLFFLLFFCFFPLLSFILPFLFGFFCLPFSCNILLQLEVVFVLVDSFLVS